MSAAQPQKDGPTFEEEIYEGRMLDVAPDDAEFDVVEARVENVKVNEDGYVESFELVAGSHDTFWDSGVSRFRVEFK